MTAGEAKPDTAQSDALEWFHGADLDDLPDGRVCTAFCGLRTVALTRVGERVGALGNKCPIKAVRSVKARSSRGGCAARGMATTTTPSPAGPTGVQ